MLIIVFVCHILVSCLTLKRFNETKAKADTSEMFREQTVKTISFGWLHFSNTQSRFIQC